MSSERVVPWLDLTQLIARLTIRASVVRIRQAMASEAETVARIQVRTWQTAYAHVFPSESLAALSVEQRAAQWREWPPLVAEVEGEIVGFASIGASRDDDASGELFAIYLDPTRWGTGVGRELIIGAELGLRDLGHEDAILWVLEDNPRARRFYERAAWRPDGGHRQIEILGLDVEEVRYRKQLERRSS